MILLLFRFSSTSAATKSSSYEEELSSSLDITARAVIPVGKTAHQENNEHRRRLGITSQTGTNVDIGTKMTAIPAGISSREGGLSWQ